MSAHFRARSPRLRRIRQASGWRTSRELFLSRYGAGFLTSRGRQAKAPPQRHECNLGLIEPTFRGPRPMALTQFRDEARTAETRTPQSLATSVRNVRSHLTRREGP